MSWKNSAAQVDIFLDIPSCTRQPPLLPFVSTELRCLYGISCLRISPRFVGKRRVCDEANYSPFSLLIPLAESSTNLRYVLVIRKNPLSSLEYHLLGLLLETARIEPRRGAGFAYLNASEHELAFLRSTKLISSSQAKGDEEY